MVDDRVEVERLDCMDRREWYEVVVEVRKDGAGERKDEPVEAVVDMDEAVCEDATELRRLSMACWNMRWIMSGRCLASKASMCRIDSSGMSKLSSMLAQGSSGGGDGLPMGVGFGDGATHSLPVVGGLTSWVGGWCWY